MPEMKYYDCLLYTSSEIILSEDNAKDIAEIKEDYVEGLKFHFVRTNEEVLELALEK